MDDAGRGAEQVCVGDVIQRRLECLRETISRELCAIPMPVPGCDVNFNRLLEDRSRVVDDLQRLARLRHAGASPAGYAEFAQQCAWLDPATREQIAAALNRNDALTG